MAYHIGKTGHIGQLRYLHSFHCHCPRVGLPFPDRKIFSDNKPAYRKIKGGLNFLKSRHLSRNGTAAAPHPQTAVIFNQVISAVGGNGRGYGCSFGYNSFSPAAWRGNTCSGGYAQEQT
ncbi:hypothetical protein D3C75_589830 [compost metagenome]